MAHCNEIAPLLSAFNDGELSPVETNHVTVHLDNCETCRDKLLDFVLLGHHLRTAVAAPSLQGFSEAVMAGIAGSRRPLRERLLYWLEELRERWVAMVSLAGAAIATASLILALAEPQTLSRISAFVHGPANQVKLAQTAMVNPPPPPAASSNSETFISRLESRHPSVAMWSEPDYKTTVIWLGDDSLGND